MKVRKYGLKRMLAALVLAGSATAFSYNVYEARPAEAQATLGAAEKSVKVLRNLSLLKHNLPLRPEVALHAQAEARPKIEIDDLKCARDCSDKALAILKEAQGTLSRAEIAEIGRPVEAYSEKIEMTRRWQQGPQKLITISRPRRAGITAGGLPTARL